MASQIKQVWRDSSDWLNFNHACQCSFDFNASGRPDFMCELCPFYPLKTDQIDTKTKVLNFAWHKLVFEMRSIHAFSYGSLKGLTFKTVKHTTPDQMNKNFKIEVKYFNKKSSLQLIAETYRSVILRRSMHGHISWDKVWEKQLRYTVY